MKFVKFGIFALSMGLFVASCGDTTTEETTTEDTTTMSTDVVAPAPMEMEMDTTNAMPVDTTAAPETAPVQ